MTLEVYKTNKSTVPFLALDREPNAESLSSVKLTGVAFSDYPITYSYQTVP